MNFCFYYPKNCENEVQKWMDFLKLERGLTTFPNIPGGETITLAWHDGKEIRFRRIGLRVGQLIIETFNPKTKKNHVHPLYPYVEYWDGEPEDKLIFENEDDTFKGMNIIEDDYGPDPEYQKYNEQIKEGIVPLL